MRLELAGKQALVTGASGDIGRAICRLLASSGAEVAIAYFSDHEGAQATAEELRRAASATARRVSRQLRRRQEFRGILGRRYEPSSIASTFWSTPPLRGSFAGQRNSRLATFNGRWT